EESKAIGKTTLPDQRPSLEGSAKSTQVVVFVVVADRGHLRGRLLSGHVIADGHETKDARQPQIAALDRVLSFGINQALRPRHPAVGPGRLTQGGRAQRYPERSPGCPGILACSEPELVKPLKGLERRLVAPGQRGRPRQPFDVVRLERASCVCLRERVV